MPFQWIQWQDGQVYRTWGYERFDCVDNQNPPWIGAQIKSDDGDYGSLGVRWSERTLPKDAEKLDEIQVNGQCLRYRLSQASTQRHGDSLERGAVKLTIEQQLGLGDMYLRLHESKRRDQIENGLLSIKMHFSKQQNILDYRASSDAGNMSLHIAAGPLKDDFGSNMTVTALTNILGAEVSELINRFVTASLTVRASMYLENGPLCVLGHLGDSTGPEVSSLIAAAKRLEGFDDLPFPSKRRSHLRAPIKEWKKEIGQMFSHLGRFESQIERFKDSHSRARCPFSQDPNDFTKAFGRTVQFFKRGGLKAFRPCLPVLNLFLPRILRAPFSQDADVQVQAFAVPTSQEAEDQEGIWTNVFCLRGAGDMLGKCPTTDRFVKDIQHDGIRAYGRLIVGCCGSSGETELFDCTHGGQIRTTVEELFPDKTPFSYKRLLNSTISLTGRNSWLIALLFDTQRSR
jgi:hypothetical protein